MLILKRIYESRCVGPWPCEDFEVLDGDRSVGRILRIPQESEGQSCWGVRNEPIQAARRLLM